MCVFTNCFKIFHIITQPTESESYFACRSQWLQKNLNGIAVFLNGSIKKEIILDDVLAGKFFSRTSGFSLFLKLDSLVYSLSMFFFLIYTWFLLDTMYVLL